MWFICKVYQLLLVMSFSNKTVNVNFLIEPCNNNLIIFYKKKINKINLLSVSCVCFSSKLASSY